MNCRWHQPPDQTTNKQSARRAAQEVVSPYRLSRKLKRFWWLTPPAGNVPPSGLKNQKLVNMPQINICNSVARDAVVNMESVSTPLRVRWLDSKNRQARNIRILKSTIQHDAAALAKEAGDMRKVGQALVDGDPEINLEMVGYLLSGTSRVFVDKDQQLVHRIQQFEIVKDPSGETRERRPREITPQNVTTDIPLQWTGKFIKKTEVVRKFVIANKMQLMHINGLTYDFLFGMAKDLQERESMMLLGGGQKSNQPLILRRGSSPYRGFLEGRTDGEKYCLILHLSNLELKSPEKQNPDDELATSQDGSKNSSKGKT